MWETGDYPQAELSTLLQKLEENGIPIAAICGATFALARGGLLNHRRHTSTVPGDLAGAGAAYSGAARYVTDLAVTDRGVITASGLRSVDFAHALFASVQLFSEQDEALWFDMYKRGRLPGMTSGESS